MNRRHDMRAKAGGPWGAKAELDGESLQIGDLTPEVEPDNPEYYVCSCGADFDSERKAALHLIEVADAE